MSSTEQVQSLEPDDYPGLFRAADAASVQRQRAYRRAVLSRLVLTVAAAAFGAVQIDELDWLALGTALAFVAVMALELGEATSRPDKSWYATRALSESVKTLTWRYVTGAEPFTSTSGSADREADREFVERISALQHDMPDVPLPGTTPTITDKMRAMRTAPLAARKQAYLTGRVIDQQNWYADKALHHQRQARTLRTLMLIMEVVGIGGALLTAFAGVPVDLAGFVAAGVSALAAWNSTRQNDTTATAYVRASHELNLIRERLDRDLDEQQWSDAVVDAETAISREHTTWHSHRST